MTKVLIFSNHPAYTYNLRKEIIDGFIRNNIDVTLVVPYGKQLDYFKTIGVKLINITISERSTNPFLDLKLLSNNVKILRKEKPDLVITYATKQNIYGGMASRITNTPYVPMITGLGTTIENPGVLQKITSFLYRMGTRKAKVLFVQNKSILEKLHHFDMVHSPVKMTPGSGVSLERHPYKEYPDQDQGLRFLYIGRIMKDKGINELLEAARIIKKSHPNIIFELIGHADKQEDLNKVKEAESKGIIQYHGVLSDVRPFIRKAHATILPSYHEGMANVLLESASTGRPILASKVPGCKETFDEGISGIGFDAKSVESLVKAIESFIDMPYDLKKKMGKMGRDKIEQEFSREVIVNMYLEELKRIGA